MMYVNNNDRGRGRAGLNPAHAITRNPFPALNDIRLPGTGAQRIDFPGGYAAAKADGLRRG